MAEKFDYADANATAQELIAEFGQPMTIEKPDGSQKQQFTGVLLDLSYSDKQNTLLVQAVGKVYVAADLKRDPWDDGDYVTIAGKKYAVLSTDHLAPGGVDVYSTLYIRR